MRAVVGATAVAGALCFTASAAAQTTPTVVDPKLEVRAVTTGLTQPVQMQFIKDHEFWVLEKSTGIIKRVRNGGTPEVILDLAVNSNSERGLLGITLDQDFKRTGTLFLYWSESTTGADSAAGDTVPLMGNRLDRYHWDGAALTYEKTIHRGRAFQDDVTNRTNPAVPVFRGNHNGGVLRTGPDGKIYLQVGDTGRRGQTQNLIDGPFGFDADGMLRPDDQFGGPDTTNDHLTGVILRLNPDGTTPRDNPFFKLGAERGGQVGQNLKKIYAYGLRNGFGMAFDPFSGNLWEQENGDDSFSEINLAKPGFNSGWTQVMGPLERVAQFKAIETTTTPVPPDPKRPGRLLRPAAGPLAARPTSPTRRSRPTTAWSSSRAPSSRTRSWPGSTRSPRAASTSSPPGSSARTTRATCSSAPPAAPCAAATSSACGSRTTARRSTSPTTSA